MRQKVVSPPFLYDKNSQINGTWARLKRWFVYVHVCTCLLRRGGGRQRQTADLRPAHPQPPPHSARSKQIDLTRDQRTQASSTLRLPPTGTETRGNRVRRLPGQAGHIHRRGTEPCGKKGLKFKEKAGGNYEEVWKSHFWAEKRRPDREAPVYGDVTLSSFPPFSIIGSERVLLEPHSQRELAECNATS